MNIDEKIIEQRIKLSSFNSDYYVGALGAAYDEVDALAGVLGVERISLHNRLDQFAALVGYAQYLEEAYDNE